MNSRCHNQNVPGFKDYGGRGIQLYPAWTRAENGFAAFLGYMLRAHGPRPEGYSVDRIDNDGHYWPGNVRWASAVIQCRNQRPKRSSRPKREPKPKGRAWRNYKPRKRAED
jgi:hypothetical protein